MSQILVNPKSSNLSWIAAIMMMIAGGLLLLKPNGLVNWFAQKNPDGWLIFVEEFDNRSENKDYSALINNSEWRESLRTNNVNFRIYDEEQSEASTFLKVVGEIRPAYVVGFPTPEKSGLKLKVVDFGPAPKSVDDANSIISKWIK